MVHQRRVIIVIRDPAHLDRAILGRSPGSAARNAGRPANGYSSNLERVVVEGAIRFGDCVHILL